MRKAHFIAFGIVFLVVYSAFQLPPEVSGRMKIHMSAAFLPLLGLAGAAEKAVDSMAAAAIPRQMLVEEVEQLRIQNQELQLRLLQSAEVWRENQELRKAVAWQPTAMWNLRLARVILREPSNWWRSIQIDRGERDGVVLNAAVLTSEGLIGRVSEVGLDRSRILLLGDPNCRVATEVRESRDQGVVGVLAENVLDPLLVTMTYLPSAAKSRPGDTVITSGLGGVFPRGIRVGHVTDVRAVGHGLYTELEVRLAADIERLDKVWVILP